VCGKRNTYLTSRLVGTVKDKSFFPESKIVSHITLREIGSSHEYQNLYANQMAYSLTAYKFWYSCGYNFNLWKGTFVLDCIYHLCNIE